MTFGTIICRFGANKFSSLYVCVRVSVCVCVYVCDAPVCVCVCVCVCVPAITFEPIDRFSSDKAYSLRLEGE